MFKIIDAFFLIMIKFVESFVNVFCLQKIRFYTKNINMRFAQNKLLYCHTYILKIYENSNDYYSNK